MKSKTIVLSIMAISLFGCNEKHIKKPTLIQYVPIWYKVNDSTQQGDVLAGMRIVDSLKADTATMSVKWMADTIFFVRRQDSSKVKNSLGKDSMTYTLRWFNPQRKDITGLGAITKTDTVK